jgi:hypothetical protein
MVSVLPASLPQLHRRPVEEAVQEMAEALVNLAPAFESIYYLVELPAEQLQAVMQYASQLQQLAQSLQMKIHMVSSKAAETTKVGSIHLIGTRTLKRFINLQRLGSISVM